MFLHIGKDILIPIKNIIAIIDADSMDQSKISKAFFKIAKEEGFVKKILDEKVKSYIITENITKNNKDSKKTIETCIYGSPISSVTLQRRANNVDNIYNLNI